MRIENREYISQKSLASVSVSAEHDVDVDVLDRCRRRWIIRIATNDEDLGDLVVFVSAFEESVDDAETRN